MPARVRRLVRAITLHAGPITWQKGETAYENHLRRYGHPSRAGFIDIIGQWNAENWQPEYLFEAIRRGGARYFWHGLHHDNSTCSRANITNGMRARRAKERHLGRWKPLVAGRPQVRDSNHSSHAWHWYQPAYGDDAEGPMRGRRYDAYWLRKHHGRGKFWDGLDPQELYTGPYYVPPDGIPQPQR